MTMTHHRLFIIIVTQQRLIGELLHSQQYNVPISSLITFQNISLMLFSHKITVWDLLLHREYNNLSSLHGRYSI
jgi:hypothetical protein